VANILLRRVGLGIKKVQTQGENLKRVAKGFCLTRDCPKISSVMRG